MTQINEAESFQRSIESHSHFNTKCLSMYDYNEFFSKRNELNKCINCYNDLKYYEKQIINAVLDKKNKEKELNNLKAISYKDLENLKIKLKTMEEIYLKDNENNLNNLINKYNNYELKLKYDLELLDKEIVNLKKEIQVKKENINNELDLKKKEELFKLTNEYKIKVIQYTNKKKLEKQKKEKEFEIKQKRFEADKAIELNKLKQKSLLVQKIILTIKNIS